ncbi:large polymerase [Sclerotinia sclerotiorum negative-stranded RNA virus 1]|uniref:RNA-directed RNA polymerase n=1 Tax=Sclerotinia sclerotiorum negative-stranded RNA virus 1 TaxID=1483724 RepID=X5ETK0_9MONO|nr:large polymerase [Sclerotinia sclerotiorum negative-stranded RNA virus 1]AHW76811.1 large polymerase [Sclerotinia sclerotiorum negative-stranded RNA virus 1]
MNFSEAFEFDSIRERRSAAPAEKHLRSPILSSLMDRLRLLYNEVLHYKEKTRFPQSKFPYIKSDVPQIVKAICKHNLIHSYSGLERVATPWLFDLIGTSTSPYIVTPDQYPELFTRTLISRESLKISLAESSELYRSELCAFKKWGTLPEVQNFIENEEKFIPEAKEDTYLHYESYRYWDFLVEKYRQRKQKKQFGKQGLTIGESIFFFYDGFIMEQIGFSTMVTDENGKPKKIAPIRRMYSFEQLQMIQDVCLARFNAFLALDANMHNSNQQLRTFLKKLLLWQEAVLKEYGNKGYELVKGPESVTKSYLTSLTQGDVLPLSSFVRTCAKLQEKERKLSKTKTCPLTSQLIDLIESTNDISIVTELFGCTKMSGHPFVYAETSSISVKQEACPTGNLDLLAIRDYHAHFKRLVLDRYLKKNLVWPAFTDKDGPKKNTKLYNLWKSGITKINDSSYPLSDLYDVEFPKFMEFDYSPDYLDMIDDKAICPGADKSSGFWFKQSGESYRRLLESLIKRADVDTFQIVERMRKGKFHIDERIVELTQKEREFKTSARCFCKLTFEVRLFFVLTETNLKRFMGGDSGDNGYLPQQTMTMTNTKLKKRLYDLTAINNRDNTCLVEVDFSRWNLRWRACSVNPISRSLEKIFGLPGVFSQAHSFFSQSTIVMTDKNTLPPGVTPNSHASTWPESDLVWRNHLGGFEGIQQTLWTICTLAMMYYAIQDEQCSFQMAGQGDNQVFFLSFNTKKQSLSLALQSFLYSVERRCERLNHEVKPEECIDSRTVLTYGKEIYIRGVHTMYSLKFSSRAFSRLDYTIPSLSKEISGVVANSVAVAGTLHNSFRAVWWKHIQVILLLRRRLASPLYALEHRGLSRLLRSTTSRKVLLIPGSLGGLPMMPWTRYFSKGESDDLSFDVAATYYLSQTEPIVKNYMWLLRTQEFVPHKIDATNLINDPHSIPIDKPNDASHLISNAVSKALPSLVNNKDIKQLISNDLRQQGENYKLLLTKMKPLHPQIAADLFELTPAGLYNKTIKRFSMTRTIEKIIPGINFIDRISQANSTILSVLLDRWVLAAKKPGGRHPVPFEMATELRTHWNLGLDNTSIGVYTPFDFEIGYFKPGIPLISATTSTRKDILTTCGNAPPNFGTSTKQKLSDHGYRIVSTNSTMKDLKNAVLTYSELQGDPSLKPLFQSIISARSPWTLEKLIPIFPESIGGTAVHRHKSTSHVFSVLGSSSVPTHIIFSSDQAGILSGGDADYPVVFQTLYMTLTNLYQILSTTDKLLPPNMCYYIPNKLREINTSISKIPPEQLTEIKWPDLTANKLAWVGEIFASEIPEIPLPSVIPHILSPSSDLDLIYSYIESCISPGADQKKPYDGILGTVDIFDFKEISRIDPITVEHAICWNIITDAYYSIFVSNAPDKSLPLFKKILKTKATYYSGEWVRIRLHPMFENSQYNQLRRINLQPTRSGYKRPVDYMATQLIRMAHTLLSTRGMSSIPRLILFSNWRESSARLGRRRLILAHAIATYPMQSLTSLRRSVLSIEPPTELLKQDPATYISIVTRKISRKISNLEYTLPDMPCLFLHRTDKEAMRMLRDRPRYEDKKETVNHALKFANHGICKVDYSNYYGALEPTDPPIHNERNSNDRLRILRRRTIGIYSPLYSDWNAIFEILFERGLRRQQKFHVLGVGRGATSRALVDRHVGVVGYDLISSLPSISHRSASYKPPELIMSANTGNFSWSNHTYMDDGDVLKGHLDCFDESKPLLVIDLDISFQLLKTLMLRLPIDSEIILRYVGSEDEIKCLISMIRPTLVFSLCVSENQVSDVVLYTTQLGSLGNGNYQSIEFKTKNEINYSYASTELVSQFWNVEPNISRHFQLDVTDTVLSLRSKLKSLYDARRTEVSEVYIHLWDIMHASLNPISLTGKDLRCRAICDNIFKYDS